MELKIKNIKILLLFIIANFTVGCDDFPQDTFNTYDEVRNEILLVGYNHNPPFVIVSEAGLEGLEVEMIREFADKLNAEIKWIYKNEHILLKDLQHRNLHLVIGGFDSQNPWKSKVAFSNTYLTYLDEDHVIAVPTGEHRFLFELNKFLKESEEEIKLKFNKITSSSPDSYPE